MLLGTRKCLIEPRDQLIVKGYKFLCFAKNMSKDFVKILSKT